jgi:hypothetical protein
MFNFLNVEILVFGMVAILNSNFGLWNGCDFRFKNFTHLYLLNFFFFTLAFVFPYLLNLSCFPLSAEFFLVFIITKAYFAMSARQCVSQSAFLGATSFSQWFPFNFDDLNQNLKSVFQNSTQVGPGRLPKFVDFCFF